MKTHAHAHTTIIAISARAVLCATTLAYHANAKRQVTASDLLHACATCSHNQASLLSNKLAPPVLSTCTHRTVVLHLHWWMAMSVDC
jgi:hypothetical protein